MINRFKKKKEIYDEEKVANGAASSGAVVNLHVSDIVISIVIGLLALSCLLPFIHIFAKSVSSNASVMAQDVYLIPKGITINAYKAIIGDGQLTRSIRYSAVVTVLQTLLGLSLTLLASWPLSRKRLKGRTIMSFLIMFTMYFGAGLIPTYLMLSDLKLLNTMWVLVLPGAFAAYNFLITRNFLTHSIQDSMEEAAYIDGANDFQIFGRIVLPLSKPIIATIGLFIAVGRWNGFQDSKFFITDRSKHMVQYILSLMVLSVGEQERISLSEASAIQSTPEVTQAAAIMVVTIPILIVYPFIQKYFVQGAMIGAVKE